MSKLQLSSEADGIVTAAVDAKPSGDGIVAAFGVSVNTVIAIPDRTACVIRPRKPRRPNRDVVSPAHDRARHQQRDTRLAIHDQSRTQAS